MAVRIGGASAFYGDSQIAARQLVDKGDIDYLVFDYLAEVTMALLARAASKKPELGYAVDFIDVAMADVIEDCAAKGIKVIANAGGVNVPACVAALKKMCVEKGLSLNIAGVYGDDLMPLLDDLPVEAFTNFHGEPAFPESPISANAYFGAVPIAEALTAGADIVITGRVVDSAVVLGPLMHEFSWQQDEYDLLAQGSLCGHIIECGAQCTGGNFTDWQLVPNFSDMSYPVAEVQADGSFTIGIAPQTGGLATVASVAEQIVYEIGDPANYLLPDVACDFSNVDLQQVDQNLVRVHGAVGRAPGKMYKVCSTWVDGFRLLGSFYMAGPRAVFKAKASLDAWVSRCQHYFTKQGWQDYREVSLAAVGSESIYGAAAEQSDTREVMGKFGLHHDRLEALSFAAKEMAYLATSGPPGMTGFAAGRAHPQPLMRVHSSLINKSCVPVTVSLNDKMIVEQKVYEAAESELRSSLDYQACAIKGEPMSTVLLEQIAFARSGDKGDSANIGVICRDVEFLPFIAAQLTNNRVRAFFKHLVDGEVSRYYIPGFSAFNFLLTRALGGGGSASMRLDSQAKTYAQMILGISIEIPTRLLLKAVGLSKAQKEALK